MIVSVGDGKLRAGGQAGAEGKKKKGDSEDEGFAGRAWENGLIEGDTRGKRGPVGGRRKGVQCGIRRWHGHEKVESAADNCQDQYSIV